MWWRLEALWDGLADESERPFHQEFFRELTAINRFTKDFPGQPPNVQLAVLKARILESLAARHPAETIQEVRDLLAANGAGV